MAIFTENEAKASTIVRMKQQNLMGLINIGFLELQIMRAIILIGQMELFLSLQQNLKLKQES